MCSNQKLGSLGIHEKPLQKKATKSGWRDVSNSSIATTTECGITIQSYCVLWYNYSMKYLDDWKNYSHLKISPAILWEYDLSRFDWQKMSRVVVLRVIQYGNKDDWYAMLNLYGGKKKVTEIIRQIKNIPARDANYTAIVLEMDKKELSCYTPRV